MPNTTPLTQENLLALLQPVFHDTNAVYKKVTPVYARPAAEGERVVTVTSSGVETENQAAAGDYVVKSQTDAEEQYIVSSKSFNSRYQYHRDAEGEWAEYLPMGEIVAIVVDDAVLACLSTAEPFEIMASWGYPQIVRRGDILAMPLPARNEVYRIDRREFDQTYRKSHEQ